MSHSCVFNEHFNSVDIIFDQGDFEELSWYGDFGDYLVQSYFFLSQYLLLLFKLNNIHQYFWTKSSLLIHVFNYSFPKSCLCQLNKLSRIKYFASKKKIITISVWWFWWQFNPTLLFHNFDVCYMFDWNNIYLLFSWFSIKIALNKNITMVSLVPTK